MLPTLRGGAAGASQRAKVATQLLEFVDNIHFGTIGVTAMAGLIFVAISLLRTIEAAFNDIWEVTRGRSWFQSIILYWAAITLGPIIVIVAGTSGYLGTLESGQAWLGKWLPSGFTLLFSSLIPLLVLTLSFAALYRLVPNTFVDWRAALIGGAVAALLWWGNNKLGALYNSRVVTYSKIYGSLGAVPLFLAGLYFSWLILLFGAQTAHTFQFRHATADAESAALMDMRTRELAAVRLMTHLARNFCTHATPPSREKLANQLGLPPKLIGDHLQRLVASGYLVETLGSQPGYTIARPLESISVHDILHAIRNRPAANAQPSTAPAGPDIAAFARYESAGAAATNVTLASMIQAADEAKASHHV